MAQYTEGLLVIHYIGWSENSAQRNDVIPKCYSLKIQVFFHFLASELVSH